MVSLILLPGAKLQWSATKFRANFTLFTSLRAPRRCQVTYGIRFTQTGVNLTGPSKPEVRSGDELLKVLIFVHV